MKNVINFPVFAVLIFSSIFGFLVNISFADSLKPENNNIEKYNFSSPAAEKSFLESGKIDMVSSPESIAKVILYNSNKLPSPQSSVGCSARCTSGCTVRCTGGCTVHCTDRCSDRCK